MRTLAERKQYRLIFLGACAIVVAIQAIVIYHRRSLKPGDFDVAREFGRRFIARDDLYRNGLQYPYMPAAAMFFAPLALVSAPVAFIIRYAVAIASLIFALVLLYRMVESFSAQFADYALETGALTIILVGHYIIRDLDDAGLHLLLLALIVFGIYSASRASEVLSGFAIALPIAIKVTPGLFIPFMILKRKWKLAAICAGATVFWIALPMAWLGPSLWMHFQLQWLRVAFGQALGGMAAVAAGTEQEYQNQSLRAAVVYYFSSGSIRYAQSTLHEAARYPYAEPTASLLSLALLMFCAWRGRAPYRASNDRQWLIDCSAVLVLMLLLSPVTWTQHMVFLLPAIYLIVAEAIGRESQRSTIIALMAVYSLFSLLLTREILGRSRYMVLLELHTQTLCMLIVLALVVLVCPTGRESTVSLRREREMAARSAGRLESGLP